MTLQSKVLIASAIAIALLACGVGYLLGVARSDRSQSEEAARVTDTRKPSETAREPARLTPAQFIADPQPSHTLPAPVVAQSPTPSVQTADPREGQAQSHEQSPEAVAAQTEANNMIDTAVARHLWTTTDAEKFRLSMIAMDPAEREGTIRKLIQAINAGELHVTVQGPPF
jgi:hypothetical protein